MIRRLAVLLCVAGIAVLPAACSQSDPGITTSVKAKLAADDTVKSYRIDVDTKDRVVTLTGAVDTPVARERAVELARNTEGVANVVDNLTVTPGVTPTTGVDDKMQQEAKDAADATDDERARAKAKGREAGEDAADAVTDAGITAAVKTKFLADADVAGLNIDVTTNNGVVTLTGKVRTAAERGEALALARDTRGVKRVVDRLTVAR